MRIQADRNGISVQFDKRGRWTDFRKKRNGIYKDRAGNTVKVINQNKIEWISDRGRYRKVFTKARRNGYRS